MHNTLPSEEMVGGTKKARKPPTRTSDKDRSGFLTHSAAILDAMANPNRLAVLTQLVEAETCVGDLSVMMGLSQSALSQHLTKLRAAGLVNTRRSAQMVYYSCNSLAVIQILGLLGDLFTS